MASIPQQRQQLSSQRIPLVEALSRERHYILGQAVELGYDIRCDFCAYRHSVTTNTCHEKAALLQQTLPEKHWSPNRVIKALYGVVGSEPYVFVLPELRMGGDAVKKKPHNGGSLRKRRTLNRRGKSFGIVNASVVKKLFTEAGLQSQDYWLFKKRYPQAELQSPDYRPFFAPWVSRMRSDNSVIEVIPEGYEAVYDKNECIPSGMESGTCTPFVSFAEMYSNPLERGKINDRYGGIQAVFIHDMPSLDDLLVDISVGGKEEDAHKTSLHLPYKAIYEILAAEYGEKKIFKMAFW
ncbi:MAG: hypothetical protein Q8R53_03485 [Nanoarchaeota archaeon]|nr:hypothetical protein [Nanoarchaeota archaeon]